MPVYSPAFKAKMVQRLTGPSAISAMALSSEIGVSQSSLSKWLRDATASRMTDRKELPRNARRPQDWSAEEKLRVLNAAAGASEAELGELLRREGLHEADLKEWRAAALEGLGVSTKASSGASGKDARRVRELEKQLRRKEKALAEAAALLVLQKKVQSIWGDADDDTKPESDE